MHELSITRAMLGILEDKMRENGVKRLKSVKIRVGELTAVEPDALRFCFGECVKGTTLEGAALDIEEVPLAGRCADCGREFRIEAFASLCPGCKGRSIERLGGDELDIVSMEAD